VFTAKENQPLSQIIPNAMVQGLIVKVSRFKEAMPQPLVGTLAKLCSPSMQRQAAECIGEQNQRVDPTLHFRTALNGHGRMAMARSHPTSPQLSPMTRSLGINVIERKRDKITMRELPDDL